MPASLGLQFHALFTKIRISKSRCPKSCETANEINMIVSLSVGALFFTIPYFSKHVCPLLFPTMQTKRIVV